jgi:signal transduction histidine kinase
LYNSLRYTFIWIAVFTAFTAWHLYQDEGWAGLFGDAGLYFGGFLFFGFITNALSAARQAQAENERLLVEVQAINAQLVEYARQVETLAALEERNRLAREVHDTLGHRLTSSAVQLEAAQRLVPSNPEKAAELIGVVRAEVREALQELRQTVGRLRAPVELELPLSQALGRLVESFQSATGLTVSLEVPETPCEINPTQRLVLYRAAQEGLTNIQRHAQATQAWLRLVCDPDELRLEVRDNGVGLSGAEPANGGFGLRGLQERTNAMGGQVRLAPDPSGGSVLTVSLPIIGQEKSIHEGQAIT